MSTTYPYYSNTFPDDIDNFDEFKDPDSSSITAINTYYNLINQNLIDDAKDILEEHPELKKMIVNADRLNLLRDSLLSIEEYYRDNIQNLRNIFIATYGTTGAPGVTTSAEIEAAYQEGRACFCVYGGRCYALSSRIDSANHYFSVFYNKTRYTVHCENNHWSTGYTDFASSSDLTSGLATKQDTLPSQINNAGKFLTTDGSALSWSDATNNTFIAIYDNTNGTTYAELTAAMNAKKFIYCYYSNRLYSLGYKSSNYFYFYAWEGSTKQQVTCSTTNQWSNSSTSYSPTTHNHNGVYAPINSPELTGTPTTPNINANSPDNQIANKVYVDNALLNILPSQTGNSGKYLRTDGTATYWSSVTPEIIAPCVYGVTKSPTIQAALSSECIPCITSITSTIPAFLPSVRILFFNCNKDGYHCFTGMDETYGLVIAKCLITNDITQNAEWSYTTISINSGASSPAFSVVGYNSATTTQINSLISQGKIVLCRLDRGTVNYNYTQYLLTLVYYDNTKAIFSSGINESSPEILTATCENDVWSYQISTVATPEYVGNRVFVATYNSTAITDIEEAYQANKVIVCKWGQTASQQYSILSSRDERTSFDPQTHAEYISRITYEFSQSYYINGEGYITTFQCRGDANLTTQTFDTTWVSPESLTVQSALTFDTTPTNNSHNPVESGGVYTSLSGKLDKSGGTMTGALTLSGAPTANLHAATKKYVDDGLALKAPLNSPEFTGTPTAPTVPNPLSNTTNLATTAFVQKAIGANIFVAEYNVTSFEDIAEAIVVNGCNFIICKRNAGSNGYEYYYCQTIDLDNNSIVFNNIFGGGSANFKRIECSWYENITTWSESVNQTLVYS